MGKLLQMREVCGSFSFPEYGAEHERYLQREFLCGMIVGVS